LLVASFACGGGNAAGPPDSLPPFDASDVHSVSLKPAGGVVRDSLATRSGQTIKVWALPLDSAGHWIEGLGLVWSTLGEDRLRITAADSNLWTVRGHAEIHTVSVRLKDRPEMGASYHAWVFDRELRLELVGAPLPTVMTVGESAPIRVRVLTADGRPASGLAVSFLMEIEGWVPCGKYEICPPYAGTVTPADGWVGGDGRWVRTDETGVAAGVFTANTSLVSTESSIRFDVHIAIQGIPWILLVGDTVFSRNTLQARAASTIVAREGQNQ
jgi:hypothetical protein